MLSLGVRYKEGHDTILSTFVFENFFTFFFFYLLFFEVLLIYNIMLNFKCRA